MSDHNKTRRISTSADVDGSLIVGYLRKSKKNERYDLEAVLHRYCNNWFYLERMLTSTGSAPNGSIYRLIFASAAKATQLPL